MKPSIRTIPSLIGAAAFCAAVLAGPVAQANPITGSIGFGATGVTINSGDLATASSFTVSQPFTDMETGTYSAVTNRTPVSFTGFVFNPPVSSITPLWTFTTGPAGDQLVYSFDATTVSSFWNPTLDSWEIGGAGIAMITGYSPTVGTWNVNLSETGGSFVFDSSAGASAPVPEGGSSMILLGSAFLGVTLLARKIRR